MRGRYRGNKKVKNRKSALVLLVVILCMSTIYAVGGGKVEHRATTASLTVTDSGDSAKVYKINAFAAVDDQDYIDTFHADWVGEFDSVVTWTAPSTGTDVAMVVDSMVSYINENDSISKYVVAANSGDTVFTITALKKGVAFTCVPGDTSQDTTVLVANKVSTSRSTSTVPVAQLVFPEHRFKTIVGSFILNASVYTGHGVGLSDSAYIRLKTGLGGRSWTIAQDSAASLPCTLYVAIGGDTTGGSVDPDTLFKENLWLEYTLEDSCSDTNMTVHYNFIIDYLLGE